MRKEPITTTELFNTIKERLKNKGKLPDILDYASGASDVVPIKTSNFRIKNCLDYGGRAGITLDLFVEVYDGERYVMHDLGIFETLDEGVKAMEKMGTLLGSFIAEMNAYISENGDDLEWKGFVKRSFEDIADKICSFAIKRYKDEKPNINITREMQDAIWFSIYGELQRNGEEAAWKYAKTAKLIDETMSHD